jgi:hypothetical protein
LSTIPDGSITLQILGAAVELGLAVPTAEPVANTEPDLLIVRELEGVREGVSEIEGGTPIIPAKL